MKASEVIEVELEIFLLRGNLNRVARHECYVFSKFTTV